MATTTRDPEARIEAFLEDWNRHEWMNDNGDWASNQWDDERAEYAAAQENVAKLAEQLKTARHGEAEALIGAMSDALDALESAAKALEGSVEPDESDYIAEGVIDPDNVEESCEKLDASASWQGWECTEGWRALRHGNHLYMNWWRNAYGNRHKRDLYVLVEEDFFEDEDADEDATEDDQDELRID
jgi:hypothetical protein